MSNWQHPNPGFHERVYGIQGAYGAWDPSQGEKNAPVNPTKTFTRSTGGSPPIDPTDDSSWTGEGPPPWADHGDDGEIVIVGENDDDYLGGGGDGGNGDGEAGMTPGAKIALGVTAAVVVGGLAYWVGGR